MPEEEACTKPFDTEVEFNSVTSDFNLYCEKRYLKELCEFLMMALASVVSISSSVFIDFFGRKQLLVLSFLIAVAGFTLVFMGTSLWVAVSGLVLFWSYVSASNISVILLSNELLVNPVRKYVHNVFSTVICFGGILGNYLTHYFTSYQSLLLIIFLSYLVGIIMVLLFLPESPSFLLKQQKYCELRKVIKSIAKTNGLSQNDLEVALAGVNSVIKSTFI